MHHSLYCRTYVNLVSVPSIETVIGLKPKPQQCKIMHQMECSCWVSPIKEVVVSVAIK